MEVELIVNLALLGILVVGTIIGYAKGFLRQAIELAGAIATFILAVLMSSTVAKYLAGQFQFPYSVALVVSAVALVLLGLSASRLIARVISKIIKMTMLSFVDRLAGAVLGLVFGMIICSLLITATLELPFAYDFRREVAGSSMVLFLRPIAAELFDWVVSKLPADIQYEEIFKRGSTV